MSDKFILTQWAEQKVLSMANDIKSYMVKIKSISRLTPSAKSCISKQEIPAPNSSALTRKNTPYTRVNHPNRAARRVKRAKDNPDVTL